MLAECLHDKHGADEIQAAVGAILHNQAAFPASLTRLASAAVSASSSASSIPASAAAVGSEFARQRVSLLGRVSELQSELATRWTDSKRANVALMRDNAALIQQMQHIRADIKHTNSSKARHKALQADGSAGSRPQLDDGGSSSSGSVSQQREDELRAVIGAQRARIIALRETIQNTHNRHAAEEAAIAPHTPTQSDAEAVVSATEQSGGTTTVQ